MTARQLLEALSAHPLVLACGLAVAPSVALLLGLMHTRGSGNEAPWKYLYSLLVYAACVPGMGAAVLTAYSLFLTHENLLDRDLLVYLLPIVAMAITLAAIAARADFRRLPGFDRLSGLMVLIAVTFVIVLAVSRTRIWLIFGGSLAYLAALAAALFGLLQWAAHSVLRSPGEPRWEPPSLPRP